MELKDQRRFWAKVSIGNLDECWEWQAFKNYQNYGSFGLKNAVKRSHRVAWEDAFGNIPNDLCVCHHCDNPACCNPTHLFLGTNADNVADKVSKNRQIKGETHPFYKVPHTEEWKRERSEKMSGNQNHNYGKIYNAQEKEELSKLTRGSENGNAKLTDQIVLGIRKDMRSAKEIAKQYGISVSAVCRIKNKTAWKHLP